MISTTSYEAVNGCGTVIASFGDLDLAISRLPEICRTHPGAVIERVFRSERRTFVAGGVQRPRVALVSFRDGSSRLMNARPIEDVDTILAARKLASEL